MGQYRSTLFTGAGSSIPSRRVPNREFLDRRFILDDGRPVDPADNDRVVRKFEAITEIAERRYADDGRVASDLGATAAEAALDDAGIDPESLDYIVVAHNFGDVAAGLPRIDQVPTLAARIKHALEIRNPSCVAYDLPFGCPGWLQGVIQSHYFLQSGDAHRALVVGTETLSRVIDPHDRDSMIYADGAGAVVMEAVASDAPEGILAHRTRSDTLHHARLLWMGPSYDPNHEPDRLFLKMRGRKLYEYALQHVPPLVRETLERAGLGLGDVAKVLLHQANGKMDRALLDRLFRLYGVDEVPEGILPMTIARLGNSSVATLPTLFDLVRRGEVDDQAFHAGDHLVFASVGAGMNVNAVVYRVPA